MLHTTTKGSKREKNIECVEKSTLKRYRDREREGEILLECKEVM